MMFIMAEELKFSSRDKLTDPKMVGFTEHTPHNYIPGILRLNKMTHDCSNVYTDQWVRWREHADLI